ncbi:hypothetical protein QBC37DRAFT_307215 [Rhypophila decipiens]|uniref:Translation machinery-associated protein 20 n=1 Tax=Rhypophila decipiens TaxID=261697 RepID=A0AAN7BBZ6_9PEZI|nr:hypothetical protein QBC37DRAFT_307215 [Rhypophila decipiens]
MFKKDLGTAPKQKLKSSIQRSLRNSLLDTYPLLQPYADDFFPKKASLEQVRVPVDRVNVYVLDGQPLFYQQDTAHHGLVIVPHLKLVHRYPDAFPTIRIDRGAIRFVLSGATLMAPGLTSKGGRLPIPKEGSEAQEEEESSEEESEEEDNNGEEQGEKKQKVSNEGVDEDGHWSRELKKGEPVVVMAEGKEEACAVGILVMGTKEVKEKGKGPVIEEGHYLGDGLWRMHLD